MKELNRGQLRRIQGGVAASCTATCADGTTVTCNGSGCTAEDGTGCNTLNSKGGYTPTKCPDPPSNPPS
jgi:hypothetical protein